MLWLLIFALCNKLFLNLNTISNNNSNFSLANIPTESSDLRETKRGPKVDLETRDDSLEITTPNFRSGGASRKYSHKKMREDEK